jgi:hypothetical protein
MKKSKRLVDGLLHHLSQWEPALAQERTLDRVRALGVGLLCGVGQRTITRAIGFHGNTQKDWSADYKMFSRSPWEPRDLFAPILQTAIGHQQLKRLVVSVDDTRVWRTGRHVPQAQWHRDPMGPAFHTNLRWGHRFLQASLVLPLYQGDKQSSARAVPIRWEMAPVVKKPGCKADAEDWSQYRAQKKEKNLSRQFVSLVQDLRKHLSQTGHEDKALVVAGDGSFCNRTVLAENWQEQGVSLILRCRKDIVLCKRAKPGSQRFYGKTKFTPEQVRRWDGVAAWQNASIHHGGRFRNVRYKELGPVHWQGGGRKQPLRLIVLASTGYRQSKNGRRQYHKPAYLLTTDLSTPAALLIQDYFDRWTIEVNHRDEKEILGVGQAQVWKGKSVSKVPALIVAMYIWLLLSALECHGPTRTKDYLPLPKWRPTAKRASCQDMLALLRRQLAQQPTEFPTGQSPPNETCMLLTAAA